MAHKISDECISCGACEPECPNGAITKGDTAYIIDPRKCTECVGFYGSSRCVAVCPVYACDVDSAHRESQEQLLEKWRKLHPGETPKAT